MNEGYVDRLSNKDSLKISFNDCPKHTAIFLNSCAHVARYTYCYCKICKKYCSFIEQVILTKIWLIIVIIKHNPLNNFVLFWTTIDCICSVEISDEKCWSIFPFTPSIVLVYFKFCFLKRLWIDDWGMRGGGLNRSIFTPFVDQKSRFFRTHSIDKYLRFIFFKHRSSAAGRTPKCDLQIFFKVRVNP